MEKENHLDVASGGVGVGRGVCSGLRSSPLTWPPLQTVYDEWFITLYNLVYTALPVLGMSLFDQVRARLSHPQDPARRAAGACPREEAGALPQRVLFSGDLAQECKRSRLHLGRACQKRPRRGGPRVPVLELCPGRRLAGHGGFVDPSWAGLGQPPGCTPWLSLPLGRE